MSHTNRLAREKSPYLLQHQHNPVDWYPWGEEAFTRARREDKPIFLSIGYSTCHWCHVMERESFENPEIAEFLNTHFVSIKVDREERPDIDKVYMTYVQTATGQGGWPLNVFLTPDLKPFLGSTYFPPAPRHGRPGFPQLLEQIQLAWMNRRAHLEESANDVTQRLREYTRTPAATDTALPDDLLHHAARTFKQEYDPQHGGFGTAPKFPRPTQPAFLLAYGSRFHDVGAIRMVLHTCDRMAAGGMCDQLGGGFARYSVDERWLVPHFEKMLYDNAQLLHLYLDAFLISRDACYSSVARDILKYVLRDMTHPNGGFYSAEDADSEGHEGKFYCWTQRELETLLTADEQAATTRHFGITPDGNFVDHSHPQPLHGQNVLSVADDTLNDHERALVASAKEKMFNARSHRIRPHCDDKILASWNGLMLGAVARAHAVLGDSSYQLAAENNLRFIRTQLWDAKTQTLHHRWRDGQRDSVQLLDAYACLLEGVIHLYEATLEPAHLEFALQLTEAMVRRFYDPAQGGFWQSAEDATDVLLRLKEDYDGAEPSGNSVAILALLKLSAITGRDDLRQMADRSLRLFAPRMEKLPQAVPNFLLALVRQREEPQRVAIVGDPKEATTQDLIRAAHNAYPLNRVVLGSQGPVEDFTKSLPEEAQPVAYLCSGTACQPPASNPAILQELLNIER